MVVPSFAEFGGLEDIAVNLAIHLQAQGHETSVLSVGWTPLDNQYIQLLNKHRIPHVQISHSLWRLATEWQTKEKVTEFLTAVSAPLTWGAAALLSIARRQSLQQSHQSTSGRLKNILMERIIGPNRKEWVGHTLLRWWQWRWKPDLLHIHGYTSGLLFTLQWAETRGIPTVYEEHQTPDNQFDWWATFQTDINRADLIVAVSEKSAEALETVCGVTKPIVTMTPIVSDPADIGWFGQNGQGNGLNNGQGDGLQHTARLTTDQNGQVASLPTIVTMARLYVTKGLDYLLEAIVQVQALYPHAQFRIYGDGPLRDELLALAERLGLDGNTLFVGPFARNQLPDVMQEAEIFVMPSILEGLPVTLVEAMAYGRPIIATNVGGIPELIHNEVNGLLCEPKDVGALAKHICRLIENQELRTKLGNSARHSYLTGTFHPNAVCDRFLEAYQRVLT
ncbi:MAG: glycosyltransferase [Chloroflexota bacterium]